MLLVARLLLTLCNDILRPYNPPPAASSSSSEASVLEHVPLVTLGSHKMGSRTLNVIDEKELIVRFDEMAFFDPSILLPSVPQQQKQEGEEAVFRLDLDPRALVRVSGGLLPFRLPAANTSGKRVVSLSFLFHPSSLSSLSKI